MRRGLKNMSQSCDVWPRGMTVISPFAQAMDGCRVHKRDSPKLSLGGGVSHPGVMLMPVMLMLVCLWHCPSRSDAVIYAGEVLQHKTALFDAAA